MHIANKEHPLLSAYEFLRALYSWVIACSACQRTLFQTLITFCADNMALWLQLDVLHSQAQRLVRDRCRRVAVAVEGNERAAAAPACLLAVDEYSPASRLVLSYWRCVRYSAVSLGLITFSSVLIPSTLRAIYYLNRQSVTSSGPTVCHLTLGVNEADPSGPLRVSHSPALENAASSVQLVFVC